VLIVVVEDDWLLQDCLKSVLIARGFSVEVVATGAAALRRFARNNLDAAIVDMGLPDMAGVELIAAAREAGMWAPILVVTGRDEIEDRARALDAGADDYIVKPFAIEEIVARLDALGRLAAPRR
jgi:DNA-binding response OmpR family regulator